VKAAVRYLRQHHLGLVAIFIALTGSAYASGLVGSAQIRSGAIQSRHIAANQVRGSHVADSSLTGADVAGGSLIGTDIAADSVTGNQVNEASLNIPAPSGVDAGTLDGIDSLGFLSSDGTAANSLRVGGQLPSAFLGASAKASDSDLFDGLNSTAFLGASAKASDSDLFDGLNSTAFLGVSAKASDSNLLDGRDSNDFLSASGKATDSNLLDGIDSSGFLGSSVVTRYGSSATSSGGSIAYAYASCNEGETVISGGYAMTGGGSEWNGFTHTNRPSLRTGSYPSYSYPAPADGDAATGWAVAMRAYIGSVPFTAYAVCVS
jgi:hypothetical protein